ACPCAWGRLPAAAGSVAPSGVPPPPASPPRSWGGGMGGGNESQEHHDGHERHHHDERINCFALIREKPIPAVALTLFLEVLAEHCGADLLRLKGIVAIAESPKRPAVIHGVQHMFHAPAFLERWPSDDRRSRLVFIACDPPREFAEALLDAIEAEVSETTGSG